MDLGFGFRDWFRAQVFELYSAGGPLAYHGPQKLRGLVFQ